MPSKRLTEEGVAKLKPPPMRHDAKGRPLGTVDYFDTKQPGLVLRVNYGGRKTWRALRYVKVTKDGKTRTEPRTHPIGRYPDLGVKEAREVARKFDPHALNRRGAKTFRQVADGWIRDHVEENRLRSRYEIVRQLSMYVYPQWENRPINEIDRTDVYDLLRDIKKNNGPRMATAVLGTIQSLMNWHAEIDEHFRLPMTAKMARIIDPRKSSERKRNHWLDNDEIKTLWRACDDLGIYGVFTKTLLLTGQRLRKVAYMRHDEVNADGVWTVRKESEREKGNVGKVKLPQMVIDLIRSLPRIEGNPHVFPATYGGGAINGFGVWKERLDKHLPSTMRPWVFHDLRRTARKLMTRAGVRPDVAELALGHSIKSIQAVYDDPIEYRPSIEHALECVAEEV